MISRMPREYIERRGGFSGIGSPSEDSESAHTEYPLALLRPF